MVCLGVLPRLGTGSVFSMARYGSPQPYLASRGSNKYRRGAPESSNVLVTNVNIVPLPIRYLIYLKIGEINNPSIDYGPQIFAFVDERWILTICTRES